MSIFSETQMKFNTEHLGVRIIEDASMTEVVEDWSKVRAPGRARRRRKQGYRQRIEHRTVPRRDVISLDGGRTLICHPAVMKLVRKTVSDRLTKQMDQVFERYFKNAYTINKPNEVPRVNDTLDAMFKLLDV